MTFRGGGGLSKKGWNKEADLDKEYLNFLIFGHKTLKPRHFKISKKTFRIILYVITFIVLSTIFFLCDYIQLKRKAIELSRLQQETESQRSQIHFFSSRLEDLEKQLSKLKDFDRRIRIIANLEKGEETSSFIGMGGPSPSDIREKLRLEKDEKGLIQQIRSDIERIQSELLSREESFSELEKILETKKNILSHTPSIWPAKGWLTSGFGFRTNPFTGLTQMHEGIDISNRVGTIVISPADGIVSEIGNDWVNGKFLVISHGFGMTTHYSHLNKVFIKIGQKVKRGDKIAEIGVTGKATGPHLHYEVRLNGVPVNPIRYILN